MRDPVPLPELERVIWDLLAQRRGRRPRLSDVAPLVGRTPLQLRREFAACSQLLQCLFGPGGRGTILRDVITYSCLTHAAQAIAAGTKVEAAALISGFQSKSNFIKQFKGFFGCLPSEYGPQRSRALTQRMAPSLTHSTPREMAGVLPVAEHVFYE